MERIYVDHWLQNAIQHEFTAYVQGFLLCLLRHLNAPHVSRCGVVSAEWRTMFYVWRVKTKIGLSYLQISFQLFR